MKATTYDELTRLLGSVRIEAGGRFSVGEWSFEPGMSPVAELTSALYLYGYALGIDAGRHEQPRRCSQRPNGFISAIRSVATRQKLQEIEVTHRRPSNEVRDAEGCLVGFGRTPPHPADDDQLVRLYFNVSAQNVVSCAQWLLCRLDRAQIPYRWKCFLDPPMYCRSDSLVLYVAGRFYTWIGDLLGDGWSEFKGWLSPRVPLLTKPVAPGIGVAEEPGAEESFGTHRCRLISEAILALPPRLQNHFPSRMQAIRHRYQVDGLDFNQPHLNPSSIDDYEPVPIGSRSRLQPLAKPVKGGDSPVAKKLPSRQLQLAEQIGFTICREAIRLGTGRGAGRGGTCTWLTRTHSGVYRPLPCGFSNGLAGVAYFLVRLAVAMREPLFWKTAIQTLGQVKNTCLESASSRGIFQEQAIDADAATATSDWFPATLDEAANRAAVFEVLQILQTASWWRELSSRLQAAFPSKPEEQCDASHRWLANDVSGDEADDEEARHRIVARAFASSRQAADMVIEMGLDRGLAGIGDSCLDAWDSPLPPAGRILGAPSSQKSLPMGS